MRERKIWLPASAGIILLAAFSFLVMLTGCSSDNSSSSQPDMTPSVSQEDLEEEVNFEDAEIITAEDGEVVISADARESEGSGTALRTDLDPEQVWNNTSSEPYSGTEDFTLPDAVELEDGSLGQLSIPSIKLTVPIYEAENNELEAMVHGVAHFAETSCWDGNVGLAGHNQGVNTYFADLHKLAVGDQIILTTALGTRTYEVSVSKEIDETDWSMLDRTNDNRITMITCVNHDLTKRLCVQGIEVETKLAK